MVSRFSWGSSAPSSEIIVQFLVVGLVVGANGAVQISVAAEYYLPDL